MRKRIYLPFKRLLDILGSLLAILILLPFLLLVAIIIKIESKGPALFKQNRIGKNGKIFIMYKIRSMRIDAPVQTPKHLLENSNTYLTKFGRFIRRTSIDELPQLYNVLKGDMSVIGPRPALWNQEDLISEREKYDANSLRPGLSGLAQIHGRDQLTIFQKAKLDGDYIKNVSFFLDTRITFLTIIKVLNSEGVKEEEH